VVNDKDIAEVDDLKCKGCGVCVTSCPARAIDLIYYRDRVEDPLDIFADHSTGEEISILEDKIRKHKRGA